MKFELEKLRKTDAVEAQTIVDRGGIVMGEEGDTMFYDHELTPEGVPYRVLYDPADPAHQLAEAIRRGGEYVDADGDAFYVETSGRLYFDEFDCFEFRAPIRPKPERKPAPARLTDCPTDGTPFRSRSQPETEFYFDVWGELKYIRGAPAAIWAAHIRADDWEVFLDGKWVSPKGWVEADHG